MTRPPTFVVIASGIVAFAFAAYGSHELVAYLRREPAVPAAIVDQRWQPQRVGAIALDAPFALHADTLPVPDTIKPLVVSTTYLQGEGDGLMIASMEFTYRAGVPIDLDGAAGGAIANMRTVPGTLSVDPKQAKTSVLGEPAIDLEAAIRRSNAEPLRMHGVVFADGAKLFIVMSVARADQPAGDAAWQKLRASIRSAR
ncbi:MAG: hypothetical protein ACM31C_33835 [Acidobacteriota bacterium]